MLGMLSHVNLCGKGAIGHPYQIDLVVTQGRAHFIQIVHGNGRGVKPQISLALELLPACAHPVARQDLAEESSQIFRIVAYVASEPVGLPGAALVDENQVAIQPAWFEDSVPSQ